MSYVTPAQVQSWLNVDKWDILPAEGVNAELEHMASDIILSYLEQRYDTSTWTNGTNTPGMVLRMVAMLVAAFTLRKAISEDDGETAYSTWLERRVQELLEGLVSGAIDLPGVDPDPNAPASASIGFYPTDAATQIWLDDPTAEGGAARWFTSQVVF